MRVYRMSSVADGYPHDTRYFREKDAAMIEAVDLVKVFEALYHVHMARADMNCYGILTVWRSAKDVDTGRVSYEVRVEEGDVE